VLSSDKYTCNSFGRRDPRLSLSRRSRPILVFLLKVTVQLKEDIDSQKIVVIVIIIVVTVGFLSSDLFFTSKLVRKWRASLYAYWLYRYFHLAVLAFSPRILYYYVRFLLTGLMLILTGWNENLQQTSCTKPDQFSLSSIKLLDEHRSTTSAIQSWSTHLAELTSSTGTVYKHCILHLDSGPVHPVSAIPVEDISSARSVLQDYIADVVDRCLSRRLQLNATTKTELIWFGTRRLPKKATENGLTLHPDSGPVHPVSVEYVSTLDCELSYWTVNCPWNSVSLRSQAAASIISTD